MKATIISIFIFSIFLTCNINSDNQLLGCWISEKGNKVYFLKDGTYMIDDSIYWNYKILNDSLFQIYNFPLDNYEGNKSIKILFLDDKQLILYDSIWSKKRILNKCR